MTAVHTSVKTDTISHFLDALAAKIPAPGDGATAGLHLAQGAALVSCNAMPQSRSATTTPATFAPAPEVRTSSSTPSRAGLAVLRPCRASVGPVTTALLLANTDTAATDLHVRAHVTAGELVGSAAL
jgi:hypothetical protein